jgi:succinoglycan biosynthesis transport protein ExoP
MDPTSRPPRYETLRDYLAVLRRNWIAIVLIAAIGAGAGLADAKRQTSVYQATSAVSFQDPNQDLSLFGLAPSSVQEPAALALENSETLSAPQIVNRVRRNLRTHESVRSLSAAVSGSVTTGGLLQITASWSNPTFAARLANSVAAIVVANANRSARATFANATGGIRHQISALEHGSGRGSAGSATQLSVLENTLGRLETLTNLARGGQVAQVAQPPTTASSPKPLRSAIIGLVLGLALAIILAFLRDALDRRLRTSQDIEASFDYPVVGHIRKRALGKVAYREAAHNKEYRVDVEAYRILRRNIEFLNLDSPPRSVVVTSGVPEEGKTTVATSLAFAMASAGKRTLLIEADLRRPDLAARLGVVRSPGLTDYLAGEKASTEIIHRIQLIEPPSQNGHGPAKPESTADALSLSVIPAGSPSSQAAELLGSKRFRQLIKQVAESYDAVVIDSPPLLPVSDTLEMLPLAEAVVVCAREAKTKREEAHAVKTALARFPERAVGVVVTGIKPSRHEYEVYSYSYGYS